MTMDPAVLKRLMIELAIQAGADGAAIHRLVTGTMASKFLHVPIRHHSPASAWLVKRSIETWKPDVALIELPDSANHLVDHLTDDRTVPPVSIISLFTDNDNIFKMNGVLSPDITVPAKFTFNYPLISYSPEHVAMKLCKARNIPAHLIDMSMTGILPFMLSQQDATMHYVDREESNARTSAFFQKLADIFQFKDFDEAWDSLFEIGAGSVTWEALRELLLVFSACVRLTLDPASPEMSLHEARERHMRRLIDLHASQAGKQDPRVMIITGGLHAIVLHQTTPATDLPPSNGVITSLLPHSYTRINKQSGYQVGNKAPRYYEDAWARVARGDERPYEGVALEVIVDVLREARISEEIITMADTIGCFHGSKSLAAMRGRQQPCLPDIIDAIYMCIVKGDPEVEGAYLKPLMEDRLTGHAVGKVTPALGRLPLQEDFHMQFLAAGIHLDTTRTTPVSIDLRKERDAKVSTLLWRVKYMNLELVQRTSGPDFLQGKTGTFTENWIVRWNPSIDVRLIELSAYGPTVEDASANMLIKKVKNHKSNFQEISSVILHCILMGHDAFFPSVMDAGLDALERDTNVITLARGFMNVVIIRRWLNMMEMDPGTMAAVDALAKRNYYATSFAVPKYASPPEDMQEDIARALKEFTTTFLHFTDLTLDPSVYQAALDNVAGSSGNDFIRGSCVGLLFLMNVVSTTDLKQRFMEYVKSDDATKMKLGEYVRGVLFVCQARILFSKDILELLNDIIGSIEWRVFTAILPSLRKSFTELEPREYDIFIERLSEMFGLRASVLVELKEADASQLVFFSNVNAIVEGIVKQWMGEA